MPQAAEPPAEGERPAESETPAERRRAVALAGHTGDRERARAALNDEAPSVRATALGALERLGDLTRAELESAMTDAAPEVRSRAAELSATGGAAAVPALLSLLHDGSPPVVEAACFALGEIGADARAAVAELSRVAVDHEEALIREAAVAALGAIGDAGGLPAILQATSDKPAVRRRAVLALAPFSGADVDAALQRALSDRDWQVRQAAEDLTGRLA